MTARQILIATLALGTAAASVAAPAGRHSKGRPMAAADTLKTCKPKSATLYLVPEDLLTRTAITPESIERFAAEETLSAGDARLAKLGDALRAVTLEPAALPQFELRLLVKVTCTDGTPHVIAGSKTLDDGRIDLSVDGEQASTHAPLRRALEALTGS